ncbi:MAG TPA: orotate phosphoribosyltransferase [Burkholderiales bacterium]|nr:orotate phosphoribosyltransferase [Burkholderiales bacterium]
MSPPLETVDVALIAADTAQALLTLRAVLVYEGRPFIYTTGWASPVYVDCRRLMSRPDLRERLMDHAAALLRSRLSGAVDVIAGAETSGIPFAAWIAERLGLPMVYVRKKPIGWGVNAQIEGDLFPRARCLLIDDLTTDGLSKIGAARALRHAGATIEHVFVLFNYDIYPQSRRAYAESGITLHALATWQDIFSATKALNYFTPDSAKEIKTFLVDPIAWSIAHGGAGALPHAYGSSK